MDIRTNHSKSSAIKKLKGFTLVELLIVMAILSILAGMLSIAISGVLRDSKLESARSKALTTYTGIQNALVQMEIKNQGNLLDPTTYGETGTFNDYVVLTFIMDNGVISSSHDFKIYNKNMSKTLNYNYPNSATTTDENEKNFRKLAKYITDNLSMDFNGYVYAAIDMSDWMVDSVVVIEDYNRVLNAADGIKDFVPDWKTKSSMTTASDNLIPFCDDIFQQRAMYEGKQAGIPDNGDAAGGIAVGYYPFYKDLTGTSVSYS